MKTQLAPRHAPPASLFEFTQDGACAAITYGGQTILRFRAGDLFFSNAFCAFDQVMSVGGGPEVAWVPLFNAYSHAYTVTLARFEPENLDDGFRLRIIPAQAKSGSLAIKSLDYIVTLEVRLDGSNFIWTQRVDVAFHRDVDLSLPESDIGLRFYRMHHQDDRPGVFLEFADPQPVDATGPQVPMTRDWIGQHEPYAGPRTFRREWKRQYVRIVFQDPDGSFATSDLTRSKWYHLIRDNRRARPCAGKGSTYLIKEDNTGLQIASDAPSHYHHVCEWGMDFHHWIDLVPLSVNNVIRAGTRVTASTRTRMVEAREVAPVLAKARAIELTAAERAAADLPAYEEPENTFRVSVLSRMDAHPWKPSSEGCRWDPTGGRGGLGALVVENKFARLGQWKFDQLGPSQWANPFIAGACYRLSAWVKLDDFQGDLGGAAGPVMSVEFFQYDGPASLAQPRPVAGGSSRPLVTPYAALPRDTDWDFIQVVTNPCPPYAMFAALTLQLRGPGRAAFSNVKWELIEPA